MKRLVAVLLVCIATHSIAKEAESDPHSPDFLWADVGFLSQQYTDDLSQLKEKRIIRALVVHSKTGFFVAKGKIKGLDAEYLKHYEKFLNQGIKREAEKIHIMHIPVSFNQLIPSLLAGRGDIAAAMLTITPQREEQVSFATGGRMSVNEVLVTHHSVQGLQTLEDLAGKTVHVMEGSSYLEHLQAINKVFQEQGIATIDIQQAAEHLTSEDMLEMLNAGIIKMTIVDDYRAQIWAKVLSNIKIWPEIVVNHHGVIGWAVRKNNPELQQSLNAFAQTVKKGTLLGNMLFNRFYKQTKWIKNPLAKTERQKFGRFVDLFKKYGQQYNFNFYSLVAQAYQESGLNQNQKSHRGAVGIMQLLPSTAADKNVNIKDIHVLENNIHAGTKYLDFLRRQYFSSDDISSLDKVLFSWAAYNAGPGNVRKMRRLAEQMGLDKNKWFRNVEIAAGRIIGTETVRYVSNIYKYKQAYLLLEKDDKLRQEMKAAMQAAQ